MKSSLCLPETVKFGSHYRPFGMDTATALMRAFGSEKLPERLAAALNLCDDGLSVPLCFLFFSRFFTSH